MDATKTVPAIQLGVMNGWPSDMDKWPQEYKDHCDNPQCKGHVVRNNLGNCYNQYSCTNCGIVYAVDSSG